jgi:replication factor C subunit 3/5
MTSIPWMEAYRPTKFEDIVLEPLNKQILYNIVQTGHFPNLLFYGPPGTGKTTTIMNLIYEYQQKYYHNISHDLIIHLNASDERGIDIIRNQIQTFVNSKSLFNKGMKFVILDEVDYMTKNAQQAMKHLLQVDYINVRFCLICNYISKIDEILQNELLKLRFNQLLKTEIIHFLKKITVLENLHYTDDMIEYIQSIFKSDIRSMVNYMQANSTFTLKQFDNKIFDIIIMKLYEKKPFIEIRKHLVNINKDYSLDKKQIIKNILNYMIRKHSYYVDKDFLDFAEEILHIQIDKLDILFNYFIIKMYRFIDKPLQIKNGNYICEGGIISK